MTIQREQDIVSRGQEFFMERRILIAEDEEDSRLLYTLTLKIEGYEVQAVSDGQAAYEEFLQHPPDLLITDISMPHWDGCALVSAIKKEARFEQIPIILITAYGGGILRRMRPLGVDLVLEKPIEPTELLQAVRELLSKTPQHSN